MDSDGETIAPLLEDEMTEKLKSIIARERKLAELIFDIFNSTGEFDKVRIERIGESSGVIITYKGRDYTIGVDEIEEVS